MDEAATARKPMTKAQLLESLDRHLNKDELTALVTAVDHGYRPYTSMDEEHFGRGGMPAWVAPDSPDPIFSSLEP